MSIEESDTVRAARERMDANKDGKTDLADVKASAKNIRAKIIQMFGLILWVSLALGVLTALGQLFGGHVGSALSTLISTVVTVGVGFVVLDIRDRMIGGGE